MDEFKVVRKQLSKAKFETKFIALMQKYPQTEEYMTGIYKDRERWAEYVAPLAFSVGSWTTSRVEGGLYKHSVGPSDILTWRCGSCSAFPNMKPGSV